MVQFRGMAMATVGLFGRAAVGFVGLAVVAATFAPSSGIDDPGRPAADDPGSRPTTVALETPDRQTSRTVTITDAAGRDLASLTRFFNGNTVVVAHGGGGTRVGLFFQSTGRSALQLEGPAGRSHIKIGPDGRPEIASLESPGAPRAARSGTATPNREETP